MSKNENIFKRMESKYILDKDEKEILLSKLEHYLKKDQYYYSNIQNIYLDSDNDDLIKRSLEKPLFKEKVRVRCYDTITINSKVYFEIKKKYKGMVSKRRVSMKLNDYYQYISKGIIPNTTKPQIMKEIDYMVRFYKLKPRIYISYNRESYCGIEDEDFRITFDDNIKYRIECLKLEVDAKNEIFVGDDRYIMEVKCLDFLPLWFTKILSEMHIYPNSFSKYGNIYLTKGGIINV